MRNWFLPSSLFDREPAGGGGSDTMLVDPGTPFEHGVDPEPEKKPAEKSDTEKRLEALERDNADLRRRTEESEKDARYWSERASAKPVVEDREDEVVIPDDPTIKPEELLDDISKRGMDALKAGGLVTKADMTRILLEQERRTETKIAAARQDAEFGMKIAKEFPEIAEDSERLQRGETPKTELFKRAGEIYRSAVAEDPSLKGTNGLLLIAARQAKAELATKEKPKEKEAPVEQDERRSSRRERIARQMPERSAASDESSGGPSFTDEQMKVMKHLGVKADEFTRNQQTKGERRGR